MDDGSSRCGGGHLCRCPYQSALELVRRMKEVKSLKVTLTMTVAELNMLLMTFKKAYPEEVGYDVHYDGDRQSIVVMEGKSC